MDESINHGEFNPMSIRKGTQFLVMMIDIAEEPDFVAETAEETLTRFRKHMFALMSDVAAKNGTTVEIEKEKLKSNLILNGVINKSTTELTLNELAAIIIRLKKEKYGN